MLFNNLLDMVSFISISCMLKDNRFEYFDHLIAILNKTDCSTVGNKHSPTVIVAAVTSRNDAKAKLPTHYYLNAIEFQNVQKSSIFPVFDFGLIISI